MSESELCFLPECILALIETGNSDKAAEVIRNYIKRIDKGHDEKNDSK